MWIVKYRKIFYTLSIVLVGLSVYSLMTFGLNLGIDFKGGTITEVRYDARPDKSLLEDRVAELDLGGFSVRPSGEESFVIRTRELSLEEGELLASALSVEGSELSIERSNTIGPVAGKTLTDKAVKAIVVVVLMIMLFVSFAFRKVSRPVSSWKYGLATIIALFHDIIIPVGVFVTLGHWYGLEIDLLFVSGLLAILGYSVHDTIVVFDRVRENLRVNMESNKNEEFDRLVGRSVSQTMARSINTSLTLFIVVIFMYFLGPASIQDFSLLLMVGIVAGVYSSIFLASPLLVTFQKWGKR